jgi:hypothetical protein
MSVEPGAVIVIAMYAVCLWVIHAVAPRLPGGDERARPWWRRTSFWASVVAVVQIVVYAIWS